MKSITDKKILDASKVTKSQIVDKIKAEYSERYDQMLIDSDILRNDIYYINFRATFVNFIPKKATFAMIPSVKSYFDKNCSGCENCQVSIIDKDFIESINNSKANIDKKEFEGNYQPNSFKNNSSYQFLKKGIMTWSDPNNQGDSNKVKKGLILPNINKSFESFSSPVGSVDLGETKSKNRLVSEEYYSLKAEYFDKIKLDYKNNIVCKDQPIYFIPDLTHSELCNGCGGEKYVICKSCGGRHEYTCPSCGGSGSLRCPTCKGEGTTIITFQGSNNTQIERCSKCNGSGSVKCSTTGGSSTLIGMGVDSVSKEFCGGSGRIICGKCYGDPARYGKVDCVPCKATGEIGKIVYIEIEVGEIAGEFFKYSNETIELFQKNPTLLFKYLDKNAILLKETYTDVNGVINEFYDINSEEFCKIIENDAEIHKNNNYPKILSEEIYYDVIPLSTLEYNHILSGTMHKVSATINNSKFDIIFHTDPTSTSKFDILNMLKTCGWNFKKAFSTRQYKEKCDKKHEIFLLMRVAKADGQIEDSEKRVLVELITNLNEFSNKEKAELFNLFTSKELSQFQEEETVFSTKERADLAVQNLKKMMKEDGKIDTIELKLISSMEEKIYLNIGKYPSFFKAFFKTWQISIPLIICFLSILGGAIFFVNIGDKTNTEDVLPNTIETLNSDSIIKSAIIETSSKIEEKSDSSSIIFAKALQDTTSNISAKDIKDTVIPNDTINEISE